MTAETDRLAVLDGREVIIEATQLGDVTRVCAVDAITGIEVVVAVPASTLLRHAERLAAQKLARRLTQNKPPSSVKSAAPARRGRFV